MGGHHVAPAAHPADDRRLFEKLSLEGLQAGSAD
jgi:3-methyladenine DNA glycosylase Tag